MNLIPKHGSRNPFFRWGIGAALIWMPLPFIIVSDIVLEIYHRIAFPIYGITKVNRYEYIRIFDRAKLPYLTWYEKIGCAYCGYVNGWLHYASTIAAKTEEYFCAIKHLEERGYRPPAHEGAFAEYGDSATLKTRFESHSDA